ncbi:MAG TPA: aldehyde dehydrogenase family protein, partial [Oligoflexia bacterium]|nr:aldehyde dehydrogenase family protein [Oligoflexia bacterium]
MSTEHLFPEKIPNWIGGKQCAAESGEWLEKRNPHSGAVLSRAARSRSVDINAAVGAAKEAQPEWAGTTPVRRGEILHQVVLGMQACKREIAEVVALETGKSPKEALGETGGAISLGLFYAGEGQRLYGRTTTSGMANRQAMTIRQPAGVAGLIIAANTPIANVAWKVFPALICGNTAVLKAAE